jgi:hypothetical protein
MKSTILISISVALNLAFAAVFFAGRGSEPTRVVATQAPAPKTAQIPKIDNTIWPALESGELPTLVERLRASGFPPSVVRAIVAAQINEMFADRRKALRAASAQQPFWKEGNTFDPKIAAAERELARQQRKLMRELFGDEADTDEASRNFYQNRSLSFLPPEKAVEIRRILTDYDERRADLYAANPIYDREKAAALDKQQRGAIAGVLTPDEMFEYDLRTSSTGNRLRDELSAFNPTEEEFRTIFKLRQPFDEKYDNFSPMFSPEESRQRFEAQRALKDQIKAALAPARAAEYDRATDSNYRRTTQLLARLELPRQNADQLWALQKEAEQRRNEVYQIARSAPAEQRTEQLAALQNEAIVKVTPLIGGPQNLDVYKQYGGMWIDALLPRPRPAPAPPATSPPTAPAVPKS